MNIIPTLLPGVLIIEPRTFSDDRGLFFESFNAQRYAEHGITGPFLQDNFSRSKKDVLRGLHYQLEKPQGKLVWVTRGSALDVIVDIFVGSPTFGKSVQIMLDAAKPTQVYIPPGFAHGFCVTSEEVDFCYKCTDYYFPAAEKGIAWNDPTLNIAWPTQTPILSAKDRDLPHLKDIPENQLPRYFQKP